MSPNAKWTAIYFICYMLKAWGSYLFYFATCSRLDFHFSHLQVVILPMKFFIKLSADKQVIVFKPGISSVIGILA